MSSSHAIGSKASPVSVSSSYYEDAHKRSVVPIGQTTYSTSASNQPRSVSSLRGTTHAIGPTSSSYSPSLYPPTTRVAGSTYGLTSNPSPVSNTGTTYSVQRLLQKSLADAPSASGSYGSASGGGSILKTPQNTSQSSAPHYYSTSKFNHTAPSPSQSSLHAPPHGVLSRPPPVTNSSATSPRSHMIATMPMPRATPAAVNLHNSPLPSFETVRPPSAHLRPLQQATPHVPSSTSQPPPQWHGYSYGLSAPGNLPSGPSLSQPTIPRIGSSSLSPQQPSYSLSQQQMAYQNNQHQQQRDVESQRLGSAMKGAFSLTPEASSGSLDQTSRASAQPLPSEALKQNPQRWQAISPPAATSLPTAPNHGISSKMSTSMKAEAGRTSSSGVGSTIGTRSDGSSMTSSSNASSSDALKSHASAIISSPHPTLVIHLPSLSEALKQLASTPMQGLGSVGLQNLGNTCFLNSILQSLNAVPELVACMLLARNTQGSGKGSCQWGPKAIAAPAYSDFVTALWSASPYSAISPNAFLKRIAKIDTRWGQGGQQDSQEFLHSLLGALQSETNRVMVKPKYRELDGKGSEAQQAEAAASYARDWHDSVVDDIFGGLLQSTIQCRMCGKESHTFEPFVDLSLPIPTSSKSTNVTLQDCLNCFTATESLEGDDSYKCEGCKVCQPHTKRLRVYRYPRVLILTLKRFASRTTSSGISIFARFRSTQKNGTTISIPDETTQSRVEVDGGEEHPSLRVSSNGSMINGSLDLSPYCNPSGLRSQLMLSPPSGHRNGESSSSALDAWPALSPSYRLISVSHHSGSLEGGHYTAVAQGAVDGTWYNFNDASVRREARPPGGPSGSAYVLFYRLAGIDK